MSYTEYLRRKAAAAPKILDTTLRLDASSYTQRVKFAASRQVADANIPVTSQVDTPAIVSEYNSNTFGFTNIFAQSVFDNSGNLYVTSPGTMTIRRITSAGVVTIFAGSGTNASTDGTGTGASFSFPSGICIDSTGTNLYVSDNGINGNTIRKIVISTAVVTTFAGTATVAGSTNGTGAAASFNYPAGLCMDNADNIYVADSGNSCIRKITTPGAVVTRFDINAFLLNGTYAICIDKTTGTLYALTDFHTVVKITSAGVSSDFAGTSGVPGYLDGIGLAAKFDISLGRGIAIDSSYQNLYVADGQNKRIRKITLPGAVVTTFAGTGVNGNTQGSALSATFGNVVGIMLDSSNNVYVLDQLNSKVRLITQAFSTFTSLIPNNKTKAGGRTPDASVFTQYTAGQAVGKEVQAPAPPPRVTLNSNTAGSLSGCAPVSEPIAYVRGGGLLEYVTSTFSSITGTQPTMTYNINGYTVKSAVPSVGLVVGSSVTISGTGNSAGNNGTFVITASTPNSFTISNASGIADGTPLTTQIVTIPIYSSGLYSPNMVPLTGSQQGRNALACRQLQGEPHRQNELGPSLFVDNTIVGIKNYNLPQNNSRSYISSKCTQCGNNGAEIGKTCAFCIGANHLHPVMKPSNTRWGPRPRKSAQPIIVNASPSNARKVGNFAPRKIPYVEKHHGNEQIGHIVYPQTPYHIPAGTPAQLKINTPLFYAPQDNSANYNLF